MNEILKNIGFFKHLNEAQLSALASKMIQHHYSKESMLFFEGEEPKALIFLVEGSLKLYKSDPKGNEIVLNHFKPFSSIAEVAVLDNIPFPASAVFETKGSVIFLQLETFKKIIQEDPGIAFCLMRSLTGKVRNLEKLIAMNLVLDSTARVAKYILIHESDFDDMKKNVIAHDLNMTPETLSRILKKFKKMDFISTEGNSLKVLNHDGMQALYE